MRVSVPVGSLAVVLPLDLAQDLYSLCSSIRKTKRLQIDEPIYRVAGDVMLHLLASEGILVLPRKDND